MEVFDQYDHSLFESRSTYPTESIYQPLEYLSNIRGFKIASLNITSLVAHIDELKIVMTDRIPDLLCLNETRLDESISDNTVKIGDYQCIRKDRNRNGGSVSICIRESVNFRNRFELVAESLEAVCIEIIKPNSKPFAVIVCYRPPNSGISGKKLFLSVADIHAPVTKKRVRNKPSPWITPLVRKHMFLRNSLKKEAIRTNEKINGYLTK